MAHSMTFGELRYSGIEAPQGAQLANAQRGVILTAPLQLTYAPYAPRYPLAVVDDRPPQIMSAHMPKATLDRAQLYQCLMFWDRVAVPYIPLPIGGGAMGTALVPEDKLLVDAGKLVVPIYQFRGYIQSFSSGGGAVTHSGPTAELVASVREMAFFDLNAQSPRRWSISAETGDAVRQVADRSVGGIAIELTNAIPVVTEVADVEDYLRFLEKRADLRRRFVGSMEVLAADIAEAPNPKEVLAAQLQEIKAGCEDLLRVTAEEGFRLTLGGYKLGWAGDAKKAIEAGVSAAFGLATSVLAGAAFGSAFVGAVATTVRSQVTVTPGPSLNGRSIHDTPFSVVPQLQYRPRS